MQTLERLDAADLAAVVTAYRDVLRSHQEVINRLNVYPVPDGDTGTNMALTVESVVKEIAARRATDMASTAKAIGYGSLMGARGNSGVILAQILRGLADSVTDQEDRNQEGPHQEGPDHHGSNHPGMDAHVLTDGLTRASDSAYRAVQQPVEGTILTVARAAAEAAKSVSGAGLVEVLEAARQGAADALARTPDLLPVLKAAGVVDSGGTGLVLLFDAFLHVADGRPLPVALELPDAGAAVTGPRGATGAVGATGPIDARPTEHSTDNGLRYEVMYLLEAPDDAIASFREVWAGLGDSIVVVGGDGLWNCHIHTGDIGGAIEAAIEVGRPRQIRVSDLWEQVEEERWVRDAAAAGPAAAERTEAPVRCAVVAVCTGEGIRRIFWSLGVHHVVNGGQSMNPSTGDLLEAVEAAPGEQVVILPNNKNIVPVAEQAAQQALKPVRIIPTVGIQEGFAALMEYDPEGDAEANVALMTASAGRIVAGEVTRAVRASSCDAGPIAEGDYLGISRDRIEVVAPDLTGAANGLLAQLIDADHHEIVTVIVGDGATAADTRRITEWVDEHHPEMATEVHQGGQPLYPYLFSIE